MNVFMTEACFHGVLFFVLSRKLHMDLMSKEAEAVHDADTIDVYTVYACSFRESVSVSGKDQVF